MELIRMRCVACRGGEPTLTDSEIAELHPQVPEWLITERDGIRHLERKFTFQNFAGALAFTSKVGEIAEEEGHHPAIFDSVGEGYGHVVDAQDQGSAPQRFHHGGQDTSRLLGVCLFNLRVLALF